MPKTKWNADPAHSQVQFSVSHMMISRIRGVFDKYEGTALTDGDDFENAEVTFSADAASVNSELKYRDDDLRGEDFFASDQFPKLTFQSTSLNKQEEKIIY